MYIILNSLQNLIRNRGRNILLALMILVVIVSIVVTMLINNTADRVIDNYREKFGSEVMITPDMNRIREEAMQNSANSGRVRMIAPQLTPDELIKYGESEYLMDTLYHAYSDANSNDLTAVNKELGPGTGNRMMGMRSPGGASASENENDHLSYFRLTNSSAEFEEGTRGLNSAYDTGEYKSREPQADGECMLSAQVMENSGLKLGDKIKVDAELFEPGAEMGERTFTDIKWDLTVVGVYDCISQDDDERDALQSAYNDKRNEIITTFETIKANMQEGKQGIRVESVYFLKEPDMLSDYDKELRSMGLSDNFLVSTDTASYNTIVKPVERLKTISLTFMIIVLIFGAVILMLLSSIAIRERKYEIGVLRAMGMNKLKVVSGLWVESLSLTLICLIIGLAAGSLIAQPVTNILYEHQVQASQQEENLTNMNPGGMGGMGMGGMGGFNRRNPEEVKPDERLELSLGWLTVLQIAGIALLLSSVSGIISTQKIIKYEPIKILMERN